MWQTKGFFKKSPLIYLKPLFVFEVENVPVVASKKMQQKLNMLYLH